MPESRESESKIRNLIHQVTVEVVSELFYEIAKAGSNRILIELKKELKDKTFRKLMDRLKSHSEKIDKLLDETTEKLGDRALEPIRESRQLIDTIDREFRSAFKRKLSRLVRVPRGLYISATVVIIVALGITFAVLAGNPEGVDTVPPDVAVYASTLTPSAGETVTFVVEASDDTALDWIELTVEGEIVAEGSDTPLVFEGGPYGEGATIHYSAAAYDEAGNEAFTSERTLVVEGAQTTEVPDLVILDVWHEWVDPEHIIIHYVIQNQGDGEAGSTLSVLELEGNLVAREVIDALSPGETVERTFSAVPASQNGFSARVCADYEQQIEESNESNNCRDYSYIG